MAKIGSFSVISKRKGGLPRLPFKRIKEYVLGRKYDLSLVFVSDKESKRINGKYGEKDKPADVLSFAYDKDVGEIFMSPSRAQREKSAYRMSFKKFSALLFIHAALHLKGYEHGSKMEAAEEKILKKFGI